MNTIPPMKLSDVAALLPVANLKGENDAREERLNTAVIIVAVAVGALTCVALVYGTYRFCSQRNLMTEMRGRADGSSFEVAGIGFPIVLLSGMLLWTPSSAIIGFGSYALGVRMANRVFLTRMQELHDTVNTWQQDNSALATADLTKLVKLARHDQLSVLLSGMSVPQQLQLRAIAGVRTFEKSIVAGSSIAVSTPWNNLLLTRGDTQHVKTWLNSPTRRLHFRLRSDYLLALAQILGEQGSKISEIEQELDAFYSFVTNENNTGIDDFKRTIELANHNRNGAHEGFVEITVSGTPFRVHGGLVGALGDLGTLDLAEAHKRLLPRYLKELHRTTPQPSVADDLPSSDVRDMLDLLSRIGTGTETLQHFKDELTLRRTKERNAVTLENLRQLWERGARVEQRWVRTLCLEALRDASRAEHFKYDSLIALWPQFDMPDEIMSLIDQNIHQGGE